MLQEPSVNFGNIVLSLSDAMDIASPRIASHQLRTAFIAWKLCLTAELSEERTNNVYLAALFHDIGALSLEEKIQLHAGFEENVSPETHCILGEVFFESAPFLRPASKIVRNHHKAWSSWHEPAHAPLVIESQLVHLADRVERAINRKQYILHQVDTIKKRIANVSGTELHPDIVDLFMELAKYEDFWLDLASPRLYSLLLHAAPFRDTRFRFEGIEEIASVFRGIIDFKSRFTSTHSSGVAECAVILSNLFGFTPAEVAKMRIAGYFHDLGKLAVPNSILEKPGKLTRIEFDVIKQHTYFTYTVLNSVEGLQDLAEWAAFHHEKLDGSGYPFHLTGERLGLGARIMAVADIFTALNEDRPYRKGIEKGEVARILKAQASNGALDKQVVKVVLDNFHEISNAMKLKQEESAEIFNKKFVVAKEREILEKRAAAFC